MAQAQLDLFTTAVPETHLPSEEGLKRGKRLRDRGISVAEAHAEEMFADACRAALYACCTRLSVVSADDVWEELDRAGYGGPLPKRANNMGGLFRHGIAQGWVRRSAGTVQSRRPTAHARLMRTWESNLRGADR